MRVRTTCTRTSRKVTYYGQSPHMAAIQCMVCLKYTYTGHKQVHVVLMHGSTYVRSRIGPPCMHARALCATARTAGSATVQGRCLLLHTLSDPLGHAWEHCMHAHKPARRARACIHGTHAPAPWTVVSPGCMPGARVRISFIYICSRLVQWTLSSVCPSRVVLIFCGFESTLLLLLLERCDILVHIFVHYFSIHNHQISVCITIQKNSEKRGPEYYR